MADSLSELFEGSEFRSTNLTGASSPENIFSILESLEDASKEIIPFSPFDESLFSKKVSEESSQTINMSEKSGNSGAVRPYETDEDDDQASLARKKFKFAATPASSAEGAHQEKISHITVERNRRKQMNEHLAVLRTLMPCFYVKRGDQASIIGGVIDYVKELQQVLQSLEAKKQRKAYSEVISPRSLVSSPRPPPPSPRPSPLSPRMGLPVSPRTPQPTSPYKPRNIQPPYNHYNNNNNLSSSHESSPVSLDSSTDQLPAANSKSPVADIEVKFSGPNVLLNTLSHRIPGQTMKIISALEGHSLEILQVNINTIDETMLNSFTIKIGIECELSAEELAQEILQTFS